MLEKAKREVKEKTEMAHGMAEAYVESKGLNTDAAGLEGTFTTLATGAVTLIVAIYIVAQISDVMPTPANADLASATNTTLSTAGSAFTLGAVALIVLVAAVILGLVGGFRR